MRIVGGNRLVVEPGVERDPHLGGVDEWQVVEFNRGECAGYRGVWDGDREALGTCEQLVRGDGVPVESCDSLGGSVNDHHVTDRQAAIAGQPVSKRPRFG